MMKQLMLMNPKRRHRKSSRRRTRRNPIGQFTTASQPSRRRRHRKSSRRRTRRDPIDQFTTASQPSRRRRRKVSARRTRSRGFLRSFRRHSRRYGSGKSISFRTLANKEMLMMGAGALVGSFVTPMILSKVGASLPGMSNKWGQAAYAVAVPLGLAMFVQKFNKPVAQGLALSAIVTGLNVIFQPVLAMAQNQLAPATQTASAYLDNGQTLALSNVPAYNATNAFGANLLQSESAFADNAWQ